MKKGIQQKRTKGTKRDLRNPLAKARDGFFDGEGRLLTEGITTGLFLRNRLELAFYAGWSSREENL